MTNQFVSERYMPCAMYHMGLLSITWIENTTNVLVGQVDLVNDEDSW